MVVKVPEHLAGRDRTQAPSIDLVIAERDVDDRALIRGLDKVLRGPCGPARVFDLAADPTEMHELADARQELVQQAEQLAKWFHTQHPAQLTESAEELPAPTEEELEILRSLGYVQ